jgi:hypothetical protein
MEIIVIVAAVLAVGAWWLWKEQKHEQSGSHPLDGPTRAPEAWPFPTSRPPEGDSKNSTEAVPILTAVLDVNKDGRVDIKDAVAVAAEIKTEAAKVADINHDGRVDIEDAKLAVKAVKKAGGKAKAKVEETVKKVKKTKSKKTA